LLLPLRAGFRNIDPEQHKRAQQGKQSDGVQRTPPVDDLSVRARIGHPGTSSVTGDSCGRTREAQQPAAPVGQAATPRLAGAAGQLQRPCSAAAAPQGLLSSWFRLPPTR
jgi:hypothetical protein